MKKTILLKSFVATFVALVKGDDAEALAQKTLRRGDNALKSQIAACDGQEIDFEDRIAQAEENLQKALVNNGQESFDKDTYIKNILNAKNKLTEEQEAWEAHKEKTAFLKDCLEAIQEKI